MESERALIGLLDTAKFIARVMSLRMAKGWTLRQLSEASGIPEINLRRLNSGERGRVTLDEAMAMCGALGYDFRVVVTDEPITLQV